ncbi:hypothetical protein [Myroides sp. LJL119]
MKSIINAISVLILSATTCLLVSCDNEPVDSYIKDSIEVGKPVVRVNIDEQQQIIREDIYATVNKFGEFKLIIRDLQQRQDSLTLFTRLFQEGLFPGSSNASYYWNQELDIHYSTVDPLRPNMMTGFVTMEYINKKAHVVKGSFDLTMIPLSQDSVGTGTGNPNIQSFKISGSFQDLPYKREEPYYLEADIEQQTFRNNNATMFYSNNNFVIQAKGVEKPEMLIELVLPVEQLKNGETYDFSQTGFDASYISENGIEYDLGKQNGNFTPNSRLTIMEIKEFEKGYLLEAEFNLELHPVTQGRDPFIISSGRLKLVSEM